MFKATLLLITIFFSSTNFVQALDLQSNFGNVEFPPPEISKLNAILTMVSRPYIRSGILKL